MDRDAAELVAIVARALEPLAAVRLGYVFGSRVIGRPRPDSDLDVAVLYAREADGRERELARRAIITALTGALGKVGERADVVDFDAASSALAFAVVRDGRVAIVRERRERVEFEARTFRRYDDDGPRRALFRRAAVEAARRMADQVPGER